MKLAAPCGVGVEIQSLNLPPALGGLLRALDCSLEGFIPFLNLVNSVLAGLVQGRVGCRAKGGVEGEAEGVSPSVNPSTHSISTAKSLLGVGTTFQASSV